MPLIVNLQFVLGGESECTSDAIATALESVAKRIRTTGYAERLNETCEEVTRGIKNERGDFIGSFSIKDFIA